MVFTSKATLPQGEGIGRQDRGKARGGIKQEFETHYKAAACWLPLQVSACHLSSKNMTNGWNELERDLTQMSDITI